MQQQYLTINDFKNPLGDVPSGQELEKGLIQRFAFEYEFYLHSVLGVEGTKEGEENPIIYLEKLVNSLPFYKQLDDESKWWVLYLAVIQKYVTLNNCRYLAEYIRDMLVKERGLDAASWKKEAEQIYILLRNAGLNAALARPSVIVNRNSGLLESTPFAKNLFECLEEGSKFFKSNVRLKDINGENYNAFCYDNHLFVKDYITKWEILAELYVLHIMSLDVRNDDILMELLNVSSSYFLKMFDLDEEKTEVLMEKALIKFKLIE